MGRQMCLIWKYKWGAQNTSMNSLELFIKEKGRKIYILKSYERVSRIAINSL
jgi:hypothetical protein